MAPFICQFAINVLCFWDGFNLFRFFLRLYSNHPVILGADNANLPHIVAIIAEAFLKEALPSDNDVAKKLLLIVKQVQVCTSKVASFKSLQIGVVLDTSDLFWKTRCRQITTSPRNCCSWHRQTSTGTFWIKMTSFYSDVIFKWRQFLLTYFFYVSKNYCHRQTSAGTFVLKWTFYLYSDFMRIMI